MKIVAWVFVDEPVADLLDDKLLDATVSEQQVTFTVGEQVPLSLAESPRRPPEPSEPDEAPVEPVAPELPEEAPELPEEAPRLPEEEPSQPTERPHNPEEEPLTVP
jgi:hypothetical protein